MIKHERYYDGWGNELHIDEVTTGKIRIAVNNSAIDVPAEKLLSMLSGDVNGRHVAKQTVSGKEYETR